MADPRPTNAHSSHGTVAAPASGPGATENAATSGNAATSSGHGASRLIHGRSGRNPTSRGTTTSGASRKIRAASGAGASTRPAAHTPSPTAAGPNAPDPGTAPLTATSRRPLTPVAAKGPTGDRGR